MKRLIEKIVFWGLVTPWRFATVPTRRSPPCVKATTDGVVRPPSAFSITVGSPPSSTAIQLLVVPRSIPIVLPIVFVLLLLDRENLSGTIADFDRLRVSSSARISAMERPDAVLFDLDGTIIDSRVPFATSVNYTLAAVDRPERKPEELWHYLGPPTHQAFNELLGDDEQLVDEAVAIYRDHYNKTSESTTVVYDGIPEMLRSLHGRVPLAVATSKIATSAVMLLKHLGLADLFDAICRPAGLGDQRTQGRHGRPGAGRARRAEQRGDGR